MPTLIAGSYERFIWGYSLHSATQTLTPLFSYPSHSSPIKTVAISSTVAASGSSDDSIKIYSLSTSTEIGALLHHTSSITSLSFYTPSSPSLHHPLNLISSSADGTLGIYDCDPFVHLKSVEVHRSGVVDLAVHPEGRVALTVGRDGGMAMVNLVRGRRSFSCRMERAAEVVEYGGDGKRFYMVKEERVTVHDAEDARIVGEMDAGKRVNCVAAGQSGLLLTGGEDRNVTAWDTTSGKVAYCIEDAHSARVKGVVIFKSKNQGQTSEAPNLIASASSDGVIRVWDVRMIAKEKPNPLAEANTKSRLTCLAGSSIK